MRADALSVAPPRRSVKAGGSSENSNATLAAVLQIARLNNIPKVRDTQRKKRHRDDRGSRIAACPQDLIERNIKRATDKSQADYTEARPSRSACGTAQEMMTSGTACGV